MVRMLYSKDEVIEILGEKYNLCEKKDCPLNLDQNEFNDMLKLNMVNTAVTLQNNICNCGENEQSLFIAAQFGCYPLSGIEEEKRRLYIILASGFHLKVREEATNFENQGFNVLLIEPKYTNIGKIPNTNIDALFVSPIEVNIDQIKYEIENGYYNHSQIIAEEFFDELVGYIFILIDRKSRKCIVYPGIFNKKFIDNLKVDDKYVYTIFEDGTKFCSIRTQISWELIKNRISTFIQQ